MIDFTNVINITIPEGKVVKINSGDTLIWKKPYVYVSLGDSIAAGHTINSDWEKDYGTRSQYGANGNTSTALVPNCYTDLITRKLKEIYNNVSTTSFARSGDKVSDLIEKLTHNRVQNVVSNSNLVTVCIGANDVLEPAMSNLGEYINTGDVSTIENIVTQNLAILNDDSNPNSYKSLFDKFTSLNPNAQYVFTTIYNPYKYLWIEEGSNGFFRPLLDTIPQMTILGFEVDELIKDGLLSTSIVQKLFSRVNGLSAHSERFVTELNTVLKNKISEYKVNYPNFSVTETKALFDTFPDRPISAQYHYNDLVNVEYTRGYDTAQMDWGQLWEDSDVGTFWLSLADKYVSISGLDINGFATELIQLTIEKVIVPDVDPHPEEYGHYVLMRAFSDVLGWQSLDRHMITFNANGMNGTMSSQELLTVDGLTAYGNINSLQYSPQTGYYFTGWNTINDGTGTSYSNGQLVGVNANMNLYAQWSNLYTVVYKHTNHTNLYDDDNTGHQECYILAIGGTVQDKFGTFASGSSRTYTLPYETKIEVAVNDYHPSVLYDEKTCRIYVNDIEVASSDIENNYPGYYTFNLTSNCVIDFRWKIAESLLTGNAQSWEDCHITTY